MCPGKEHEGKKKTKLSVNVVTDVFNCWSCSFKGRSLAPIFSLKRNNPDLEEYNSGKRSLVLEKEVDLPVKLPDNFQLIYGNNDYRINKLKQYLYSRGIDDDLILRYKMGCTFSGDFLGRIIIPSFDEFGNLNFFVARSVYDIEPKYSLPNSKKKDIIFNDLMIDWKKPIILVEGVLDSIVHSNSIPLLGKTLKQDSKLFQKIVAKNAKVFVALDDDAEKYTFKIAKLLESYCLEVLVVPMTGHDQSEMGIDKFRECLLNSRSVEMRDIIR